MEKKQTSIFITLLVIVFIDMLGLTIAIPIIPSLLIDLKNGLKLDQNNITPINQIQELLKGRQILLGWLLATYPLAALIGSPILGALSDKHGRKKILSISVLGTLIGFLLFIVGVKLNSLPILFVSRFVDGISGGNITIIFSAISDLSKPEEKSKNFGFVGMAFGIGFIIGPFIGGVLSDFNLVSWFDYSVPFYLSAFLIFISFVLVRFILEETNFHTIKNVKLDILTGFKNVKKAFQIKDLRMLFITMFAYVFGFNFFTQFFQVFLIHKFQFSQSEIGYTFGWIGLFIIITQGFINLRLSKKVAANKLVSFFMFSLGISFLCLWIPQSSWMIFAILPFMSISQAMVSPNIMSIISSKAGVKRQGEIMGINNSVQSFAAAIPPICSGYLVSMDISIPIKIAACFSFLAWFVFKFVKIN